MNRGGPPGGEPAHTHWIESDAYDRDAFARLCRDSPSCRALAASGARLLPHFEDFLLDLFALLFKMNVVVHPAGSVVASASLYRLVLDEIRAAPAVERIRSLTVLDETAAGIATLLLGEALLDLLRSERVWTRAEMLDLWSLEQQQNEVSARRAEADSAEEIGRLRSGQAVERQLRELEGRMRRESDLGARRLAARATRVAADLAESAPRGRARIGQQVERTLADLETAREEAERWSLKIGGGERSSRREQIELGRQLARNPKLKRIAELVGRMRENARALRRKKFERANAEAHAVETGAELSRLLPSEFVGLRHPALRREFGRRLVERQLLLYRLRAPEQKGRGPMIVCLDGSSSMAGEKEVWSKAVTLTLLDIAARQRRRFRSICFSSSDAPLQILDLNAGQRHTVDVERVFELAEYFPGGGTDFQKPLAAALDCLARDAHRRGDVVFITDGECRVDPEWLAEFRREKERLGFSLYSVLIDVGSSSIGTLKSFSDRITSVTQLTTDATRDLFVEV